MGRMHKQKTRDKNQASLPQTPQQEKDGERDDLEFAQELGQRYEIEQKPGFPPTGVRRRKQD